MPKKNTIEEVKQVFVEVHQDSYSYEEFTEYKNNHQKIDIYCKKHDFYFNQAISSHKSGIGCPKCGNEKCHKIKTTKEDFVKKATDKYGDRFDYSLIEYNGIKKTGTIICKEHGEFQQVLIEHLKGVGCKKCKSNSYSKSKLSNTEEFIVKANKKHNNYYTYENSEYTGARNNIKITCPIHGDFTQISQNHLIGHACVKCGNKSVSKVEEEVIEFLIDYVEVETSNRNILNGSEIDIFIPSKGMGIEFNGLYWHSDKFKDDNYHLNKTKKCEDKGLTLIHIFEDEWRDKKDIVKSRLLNSIGYTETKIYARNCQIKEVSSKESSDFLDSNHIQGKLGANIRLGLYHQDKLVSLMTFGNLRKALGSKGKKTDYELLRFCNALNTSVIGGASKLLKHFETNYEWTSLKSYADRRWSKGKLYYKLGFDFIGYSTPNYFYTKGLNRENRFKYRKSQIAKTEEDKQKTEKQIMKERGYERIYYSGTLKFIKLNNSLNF